MVIKKPFVLVLIVLSLTLLILTTECAPYDLSPFHSKEEKIAMWKELWDTHPNTEYTSVGKTYSGQDIWLFSVGSTAGGLVLWDGEMHGGEDKGSEILYLMAKWLLESGDQRAAEILEENHVLFIPVINDRNERGNGNVEVSPHGVDLNRNFETGWSYTPPGDDEWCCSGAYSASEPETKALRSVFLSYKPIFYVNMHCGAGPYAAYNNGSNQTLSEQTILKTKEVCNEMAVAPYPTRVFGSRGFAIGDAVALGVQSAWLIECVGSETAGLHLPEHYEELVTTYFPKCLAFFIATCELCASETTVPDVQDNTQTVPAPCIESVTQHPSDSRINSADIVRVNATLNGDLKMIKQVTLYCVISDAEPLTVNMTKITEKIWSGQIPSFPNGTKVTYTVISEENNGAFVTSKTISYQYYDSVIPEFSPCIITTLLIVVALFAIAINKKRKSGRV